MTIIEELKALDRDSDKHDNLYARMLAYIEEIETECLRGHVEAMQEALSRIEGGIDDIHETLDYIKREVR